VIEFAVEMLDNRSMRIGHLGRVVQFCVVGVSAPLILGFAAVYTLRLPLPTRGRITAIINQTTYVATTLKDGRILFTPYPNYTQLVYEYQPWLTVLQAWWYRQKMPRPKYGEEPPEMVAAVLFDPTTRKFSYTSAMNVPSEDYTSVVLQDGRVFFNGTGRLALKSPERAPELYDPRSGKFAALPSTHGLRMWGRKTVLLNSGKLLIVRGEYPEEDPGDPPLLWDPGTNRIKELRGPTKEWRPTIAVTLDNGKILFIGAEGLINRQLPTLELYDPATEQFSFAGSFPENFEPCSPVKLREGKVFILDCEGSMSEHFNASTLPTRSYAEIYDSSTGRLQPTPMMITLRLSPLSILLKDGSVLLVGGLGFLNDVRDRLWPLASAEIYNPDVNEFEAVGSLPQSITEYSQRMGGSLMLLRDGRVLYTAPGIERRAALYDPFSRTFGEICATDLASGFKFQLDDGSVLLVGSPAAEIAELFNTHNGDFQPFPTGIGHPTAHWTRTIRRFFTGYPADRMKQDRFVKR
jgi:hypothetical protein